MRADGIARHYDMRTAILVGKKGEKQDENSNSWGKKGEKQDVEYLLRAIPKDSVRQLL